MGMSELASVALLCPGRASLIEVCYVLLGRDAPSLTSPRKRYVFMRARVARNHATRLAGKVARLWGLVRLVGKALSAPWEAVRP